MKAIFFFSCVLLAVLVANAQDVEVIPMFECSFNSSCIYQAAWFPNGTIGVNQWAYYSFDLTDLNFDQSSGLAASLLELR
jgi:hypothetical protein